MQIILTQLTYQDPLQPLDNFQFVSQLAELSELQLSESLNTDVSSLLASQSSVQAVGMLGHTVNLTTGPSSTATPVTGTVQAVTFSNGQPQLTIKRPAARPSPMSPSLKSLKSCSERDHHVTFWAIYIGISGMDAFTQGLQTISNNVANLNTSGYKELTTSFSDMFNESDGGLARPTPSPRAMVFNITSPRSISARGPCSRPAAISISAIQGNGFLVLLNGSQTVDACTGSFAVDSNGDITEQGTQYQLGVLNSSGQPVALNVAKLQTNPAVATTNVTFEDNLSSSATSDTVSSIKVYDFAGTEHTWQVSLGPHSSTTGEWDVTITDETGATVGTGKISFTAGVANSSADQITVNTTYAGAKALSVLLDFSAVTSNSTGTTSTLQVNTANGSAAGTLTGVTVNSSGQIQLNYSNNATVLEGSVALANFLDPQQLQEGSNGVFENATGAKVTLSASGANGAGTLVSQQIEGSNVNLTQEFGDLILIQRGYQASSQVVSVANDMIQELFGIRVRGEARRPRMAADGRL